MGGDHDVVGRQVAVLGADRAWEAEPQVARSGLLEHLAAVAVDRLRQRHAELARVELRLVIEANRPA
jgi:hypothetical protein